MKEGRKTVDEEREEGRREVEGGKWKEGKKERGK
jgi:hypothetical protein